MILHNFVDVSERLKADIWTTEGGYLDHVFAQSEKSWFFNLYFITGHVCRIYFFSCICVCCLWLLPGQDRSTPSKDWGTPWERIWDQTPGKEPGTGVPPTMTLVPPSKGKDLGPNIWERTWDWGTLPPGVDEQTDWKHYLSASFGMQAVKCVLFLSVVSETIWITQLTAVGRWYYLFHWKKSNTGWEILSDQVALQTSVTYIHLCPWWNKFRNSVWASVKINSTPHAKKFMLVLSRKQFFTEEDNNSD